MEGPVMAGMFDNDIDHPNFSWNYDNSFKYLGEQDKREDYLKSIAGQAAPSEEMIAQLRDLDESELRQAVRQIPDDADRKEMLEAYYNLGM